MKEPEEFYEPEIEAIPRERIEKLQLERLKWQVKRCYKDSEFYRSCRRMQLLPQILQNG